MKHQLSPLTLALASALSLTLAGCGGSPANELAPATTFLLPGVAATGAAFPDGSSVTVTDAEGAVFSSTVQGGVGGFSVTVKTSAKAPFVVQVSAEGEPTYVSVSTEAQPKRVNVTKITTLIAATLSPSGNPLNLAADIKANAETVTADKLSAKKQEVMTNILKPVTDALVDTTDPISGIFEIGKGHDLVLEALDIQVRPTGANTSNVSVTLKSNTPIDMAPITLGSGAASTLPKLADAPAFTAPAKADLPSDGLPNQLAALLSRMTACYALPASERITAGGVSAADIKADACKTLFLNNNPALYKHNSYRVSSTENFKGIFSNDPSAKDVKFLLPSFEYKVKNGNATDNTKPQDGDVVFTAKSVDGEGNSNVNEFWARPDAAGQLFLTGNLSNLDIVVNPFGQLREFPNQPEKSFYSTGYDLFINAKHPYAKVVVTSPKGNQTTLLKAPGYDYFTINKAGAPGNSVLRLAGGYVNPATPGTPRAAFTKFVWAGEADMTDAEIAALGRQGTWSFELFTNAADTTPAVVDVKRRTLQRAATLAELKGSAWPSLVASAREDVKKETVAKGYIELDQEVFLVSEGDKDDQPAWDVPKEAWSPTKVTVFGTTPTGALSFNDAAFFRPSARLAVVKCSKQSSTDSHCDASGTTLANGAYPAGTRVYSIQWNGYNSQRVRVGYSVDLAK